MTQSDLLIFLDIDGTMMSTNGLALEVMVQAASQHCGREIPVIYEDFVGNLDPLIVQKLLQRGGFSVERSRREWEQVYEQYATQLSQRLREHHVTVYPGVIDFLELLQQRGIPFGILSGNTRRGAEVKLRAAGLWHYFSFGVYGDDGPNRSALPPVGVSRAEALFNRHFEPNDVWIVGDAQNDFICARDNGFRSCLVNTGRSDETMLKALNPDLFLETLEPAGPVLEQLIRLTRER